MSIGITIGIVFLILTIITFIIGWLSEFPESVVIIMVMLILIGAPCCIIGTIETAKEMNMAKPGYIINISNERNIEVVQRKKNYIQYIDNGDTLVVSKSVWINEVLQEPKIVNIKNF